MAGIIAKRGLLIIKLSFLIQQINNLERAYYKTKSKAIN